MQTRPASADHQGSWGPHANGQHNSSQPLPLPGLGPSPWQQTPATQWGLPSPQPGMSGIDLRSIMQQEEQQAALQGRTSALSGTHNPVGMNPTRDGSPGSSRHGSASAFPPPMNMSNNFPGLAQQPQQQLTQQLPQQRSGGFYMRNKRDESVPVKQNWAKVNICHDLDTHQPAAKCWNCSTSHVKASATLLIICMHCCAFLFASRYAHVLSL